MTATTATPEPDRLLTTEELAKLLGCSKSLLTRARVYGTSDLPGFIRLGKAVRYKMSTVQAFLASKQEYQHTTQADAA